MALVNDKKVEEFARVAVERLHLAPLSADPDNLENGDIWYTIIDGSHSLKIRFNGSTLPIDID